MKKKSILLLFILVFTTNCNQKIYNKDKQIYELVNLCIKDAQKSFKDIIDDEKIEKYCKCSSEKTVNELTAEEILELKTPTENPNFKLFEKLGKVIKSCCALLK